MVSYINLPNGNNESKKISKCHENYRAGMRAHRNLVLGLILAFGLTSPSFADDYKGDPSLRTVGNAEGYRYVPFRYDHDLSDMTYEDLWYLEHHPLERAKVSFWCWWHRHHGGSQ